MNRLLLCLCVSILMALKMQVSATHIVGGYIRYDCVGPANANATNYDVTVYLYRDVVRGNPLVTFTPAIPLTVFTNGVPNVTNISLLSTKFIVDSIQDPCFVMLQ